MKRRTYLRATGAGVLAAFAGCTGGTDGGSPTTEATPTESGTEGTPAGTAPFEHPGTLEESFETNGDYPADEDPADGRPPAFPDPPAAPEADPSSFETLEVNGETVRLAPIDVVEAWYRRGEARFVDARGLGQYTRAHVFGAVFSQAQRNSTGGGIGDWPTGDRVVTYCGCPHHLSSIRAAGLQKAGYPEVYALFDGFGEGGWTGEAYPMSGTRFRSETRADLSTWTISGVVDPEYAGEYVWASAARQYEAGPVDGDGRYALDLHFSGVSAATPVTLSTPTGSVTRPLAELASGPDRR